MTSRQRPPRQRPLRRDAPRPPAATPAGPNPAPSPERKADALAHELEVHRIELEMQNQELRRTQHALEAARDRYIDLYDVAPVGYFTLDAGGAITEVNLTAARQLGAPRPDLLGRHFVGHVAPAEQEAWHRYAAGLMRHGGPSRIELSVLDAHHRRFDLQIDGVRAQQNGDAAVLRFTLTDVSERKRNDAELRLAATAFEVQEGMMITNAQGVIERVNQAFTQITGYSASEAIGQTARLLHSGRHDKSFYAAMWESLHRTGTWQGEVWNRRKCGEIYAEWLTITAVQDGHRSVTRYVGTMLDISQRKAREEEIAQLAFYDPLTGLPNRRLLKDRMHQAMAVSARTQRDGGLIFVDLDHFKEINDSRGHDMGDLLLKQVAQRLLACVREGDTVARLGGDEFVVMLAADLSPDHEQAAAQAKRVGEKILAQLGEPYELGGEPGHCSASLGVALFCDHQDTADDLLKRADLAMYQAKSAGRNTLCFFDPAVQHAMRLRSALETELRQAIRQHELVLHFQPVCRHDGRLLGSEALVRWQHPQRGLEQPAGFIPVAEDRGLILALGRWVLETACAQLAAWARDPMTAALTVAVNVSTRELRDPRFVPQVIECVERAGIIASRLTLELTESLMLDNVDDSIAKLVQLKARGVRLALDDFGTGHAALTQLKRLPIDQLKIDRAFVKNLPLDRADAAIARTLVDLGRNLGLSVVAEGVETRAQLDLLAGFGCEVFQGFLFGRPTSPAALVELARRQNPPPLPGPA